MDIRALDFRVVWQALPSDQHRQLGTGRYTDDEQPQLSAHMNLARNDQRIKRDDCIKAARNLKVQADRLAAHQHALQMKANRNGEPAGRHRQPRRRWVDAVAVHHQVAGAREHVKNLHRHWVLVGSQVHEPLGWLLRVEERCYGHAHLQKRHDGVFRNQPNRDGSPPKVQIQHGKESCV